MIPVNALCAEAAVLRLRHEKVTDQGAMAGTQCV